MHFLRRLSFAALSGALPLLASASQALAEEAHKGGGEANLKLPNLASQTFLGLPGNKLLMGGLIVCILGMIFGLAIYKQLKGLPVHKCMREISELIYETCKTYLFTQGKFILMLWAFIGTIMVVYFGVLQHYPVDRVLVIMLFSLIGIAGSYGVAWFGIRVNTFANSRTAFASLKGKLHLPIRGEVLNRFGALRAEGTSWKGITLRANSGQPVHAIATGRVIFADWLRGFGNMIIVDHGGGYLSLYSGCESLLKRVGDEIKAGDTIATTGNSGGMADSGLYFEIRQNGRPLDPLAWAG